LLRVAANLEARDGFNRTTSQGWATHNFGQGPDMARVIEAYLENPTSSATQFTP